MQCALPTHFSTTSFTAIGTLNCSPADFLSCSPPARIKTLAGPGMEAFCSLHCGFPPSAPPPPRALPRRVEGESCPLSLPGERMSTAPRGGTPKRGDRRRCAARSPRDRAARSPAVTGPGIETQRGARTGHGERDNYALVGVGYSGSSFVICIPPPPPPHRQNSAPRAPPHPPPPLHRTMRSPSPTSPPAQVPAHQVWK